MFDRPDGPWEIVPFAYSVSADQYVDRLDRWSVEQFLRPFTSDYMTMRRLRRLLSGSYAVGRFTDDEVIDLIVAGLVSRELLIRTRPVVRVSSSGGGGAKASPQPAPSSSAAPVSTPKTQEPDPNTFSDDHDANAQSSSLAGAAASGVPFVQECQVQGQTST